LPHSGIVGRYFLKLINRLHVNVTTADLPGPPLPLYLAGAQLLEMFPMLPLIGRVSLGVGAISYAGQFNIAAIADGDSYPDIDVFAEGVREDLKTMELSIRSASAA
jgi:diacylglycerol O-acyltransferase